MKRFDAKALYAALDDQRRSRGLSWSDVAADFGVSPATIQRTRVRPRIGRLAPGGPVRATTGGKESALKVQVVR